MKNGIPTQLATHAWYSTQMKTLLCDYMHAIQIRDKGDIQELAAQCHNEVCYSDNKKENAKRILAWWHKKRYPLMTAYQQNVTAVEKELRTLGVTTVYDHTFEVTGIHVQWDAKTTATTEEIEEIVHHLTTLHNLSNGTHHR